jgi:hypothetical protein
LQSEIAAWSNDVNNTQRGVDWQMKGKDARGNSNASTRKSGRDSALVILVKRFDDQPTRRLVGRSRSEQRSFV